MPKYSYEAADRAGKKSKASLEAENEAALRQALREKGLVPLSITEVERGGQGGGLFTLKRVTSKDLLLFTQELGNLLEAGLPIDRALLVLSEHSEKASMRVILAEVYADIQRGQSLSQALSGQKAFPYMYVNMIKAGEAGGILEAVIQKLASFLETSSAFKEEVVSALVYPAFITLAGGTAVAILMIFVIPKFAMLFEDMGQALPAPTQILLSISNAFVSYWWAGLAGAAALYMLIKSYARTAEGRLFIDGLKLRTPIIRKLHMGLVIARFSRTLGTLLHSGVPVLEAIRISRDVVGNIVVSEKLKALEDGVSKGRGVAAPLLEIDVFPPIVARMIAVGEEAGRLEDAFLHAADRFEAETRTTIKRTAGLVEPLLLIFMGLIVAFIVISMLMAVFSINEIPI